MDASEDTDLSANGCTHTHTPNEMPLSTYNKNSSIILKVYDSLSLTHTHTPGTCLCRVNSTQTTQHLWAA